MTGPVIGGSAETRERPDCCARYGITPDIAPIRMPDLHAVCPRMQRREMQYRFVIDIAWLQVVAASA